MTKPTLYLMMGYPGSGKTTTAEVIARLTGAYHLSSDRLRLELFPQPTFSQAEHDELYRKLNEKTETLLKEGRDVIYDANLNRRTHRDEKYLIGQQTGAKPMLLWVQTARPVAKVRASHEDRLKLAPKGESLEQMFDRIADVIEEPMPDEHPISIDGTCVADDYIRQQLGL